MNSELIRLMRPSHWVKNLFVFLPVFFGHQMTNPDALLAAAIACVAFCLAASAVYCLNDIIDVEADRRHPVKRKRPIASGSVSVVSAYIVMTALAMASIAIPLLLDAPVCYTTMAVIAAYLVMDMAYCLRLKQYAIIDICLLSLGFVLRILAGGTATGIVISHWLVMMTFLVTLFLAFTKRNDDYRIYEQTGTKPRVSITGYNKTFINEATAIIASVTLVCYIMYTMSPEVIERMGTRYVYLTSGWVLAGLLRYLQNMIVFGLSGSPTKSLVKDHFVQLCIIGWIASFFVILYL